MKNVILIKLHFSGFVVFKLDPFYKFSSIIDHGDNASIINCGDNTSIIDRGDNTSIIDRGAITSIIAVEPLLLL